jgi:hypothetical protein
MNKWVFLLALLLSLAGAVLNNLVSQNPVDWIGSPQVLQKPEGY